MKKKIILWTLCILWATMIFMFSHQNAELSADVSQGFTARILLFLSEINLISIPVSYNGELYGVLAKIAESVDTIVRKVAHFSIYSILGVLVYELCLCYFEKKKAVSTALMCALLYAVSDEIHQIFIPGRAGLVTDVVIDFLGSGFGMGMYLLLFKRKYIKK